MNSDTINFLTALALLALNIDLAMQIWRVWKMQSSEDVSISGVCMRTGAVAIILLKYLCIQDQILIWGQTILAILLVYYVILLVRLRPKKKAGRKKKRS